MEIYDRVPWKTSILFVRGLVALCHNVEISLVVYLLCFYASSIDFGEDNIFFVVSGTYITDYR